MLATAGPSTAELSTFHQCTMECSPLYANSTEDMLVCGAVCDVSQNGFISGCAPEIGAATVTSTTWPDPIPAGLVQSMRVSLIQTHARAATPPNEAVGPASTSPKLLPVMVIVVPPTVIALCG